MLMGRSDGMSTAEGGALYEDWNLEFRVSSEVHTFDEMDIFLMSHRHQQLTHNINREYQI
jgi:hypothetical protein